MSLNSQSRVLGAVVVVVRAGLVLGAGCERAGGGGVRVPERFRGLSPSPDETQPHLAPFERVPDLIWLYNRAGCALCAVARSWTGTRRRCPR